MRRALKVSCHARLCRRLSLHLPTPPLALPPSLPLPSLTSLQLFDAAIEYGYARSNLPFAQSAFEHMCQAGVPPSAATFAYRVAALRQQLPEEEVAELVAGLAEQAEGVGPPGQAIRVRCCCTCICCCTCYTCCCCWRQTSQR